MRSNFKVIGLLIIIGSTCFSGFWLCLFSATSLPGNKMFAGMIVGLAESSSSILAGYVCKYVKD